MSLGTAIFLSALLLGIIFLYRSTSDRWNWKRGIKRGVFVLVAIIVVSIGGYLTFDWISNRPKKQSAYMDLKLGMTANDVLFLKGQPYKKEPERWVYRLSDSSSRAWDAILIILFDKGKVDGIVAQPSSDSYTWRYSVNKISYGDSLKDITKKFGEGYTMSQSVDGLSRIYNFPKHQVLFELEQNKVKSLGIFEGKGLQYINEISTATKKAALPA